MKFALFTFLAAVLMQSCLLAQTKLIEEKYGYVYYISRPDYMSRTFQLDDGADLQLQNTARETYALVLIEAKELFKELGANLIGPRDYFDLAAQPLTMASSKASGVTELEVNGNPALQGVIISPFDEVEIAYLLTVVETNGYFYQILCWTPNDSKDLYFPDFKEMVKSFRTEEP